jgi:hypothetical protein
MRVLGDSNGMGDPTCGLVQPNKDSAKKNIDKLIFSDYFFFLNFLAGWQWVRLLFLIRFEPYASSVDYLQ